MVAVIKDSRTPTTAIAAEYGKIIKNVSKVSGILGTKNSGRVCGSCPMSPTVLKSKSREIVKTVSNTMHKSGDGIDFRYLGVT